MAWTEDEDNKQMDEYQTADKLEKQAAPEDHKSLTPNTEIWSLLEKVLHENVLEKRRARRWKIFFRLSMFAITLTVISSWFFQSSDIQLEQEIVAIIPMQGLIGNNQDIDSSQTVELLDRAYDNRYLKGVVIKINSPGGSPVHSGIIYDAIQQKKKDFPDIPVIAIVEDIAASGGYYIISAASEIYADKASLVGSIGVISSGFDASNLIEKIGVERRTFIAGRNKAFLDPFTPMTEEAKSKWQAVLDETHQQFIQAVKTGRGSRLTITDDVFSGMVFTGAQAEKLGLIDGLSNIHSLLKARFPNAKQIVYQVKEEPWKELVKDLGVEVATKVLNQTHFQ